MWLNLRWIFLLVGAIAVAAAVSIFSGYSAFYPDRDILWQISPVGLIFSFNPEILNWPSGCHFAGQPGPYYDYLTTYLKTCLLELPFYFLLLRKNGFIQSASNCFLVNLCTHPVIFFVIPCLFNSYFTALIVSEIFAPAIEILITLMIAHYPRGTRYSPRILWVTIAIIAANLFSWQFGLFLY